MIRKALLPMLLIAVLLLACVSGASADGTWVCPKCGHENPERANFCGSCREPRPSEEIHLTSTSNAWVCSLCGEICPDEDSFCMMCGNDRHDTDQRALLIPAAEVVSATMPPARVETSEYTFSSKDEELAFDFVAPVTGTYRVFVKTADSGFSVRVRVFDSQGFVVSSDYLQQNQGYDADLTAGAHYTFRMIQNNGLGSFTLAIGIPKDWTDLGDARDISDSITFRSQDNRYVITPLTSGVHRFWIAQAASGFSVRVRVFDRQGYVKSSDYIQQNQGISADLTAGETYDIHVIQNNDFGDYELKIGCPKPTVDISGCTLLGDSIVYREQENIYTFCAGESGEYRFTLAKADQNFSVRVRIFDPGGYLMGSDYIQQGQKVRADLTAGTIYTVMVIQNNNYGTYSLQISH